MKKLIAWIGAAALAFSLTACGGARELTKMNQVKDLATSKIIEVDESTKKDIEKLYGTGTADEYGYEVYRNNTVKAVYDENDVLQSIVFLDSTMFESLIYQEGVSLEETQKALSARYTHELANGVFIGAAFNTQGKPCYSNSEDALCSISVQYTTEGEFDSYDLYAIHLEDQDDIVPADAYEKANTILEVNLDAAKLAVKVADQVLDFELTYEEGAEQVERLCDRMEKGNALNSLVCAEVSLLATELDTQAFYQRRGAKANDKEILKQRNDIAKEIGEKER